MAKNNVEEKTKEILTKAKKGKGWVNPRGIRHIPLLVEDEIVGNLWEDVELKSLEIGTYWEKPCCVKVELLAKDKVVGMLWVSRE